MIDSLSKSTGAPSRSKEGSSSSPEIPSLIPSLWDQVKESFLGPVSYRAYEWRRRHPGASLSEIPVDHINVGLPNVGNTCWLNASLKFMAATHFFDSMLEPRQTWPLWQRIYRYVRSFFWNDREDLREFLRDLFIVLRTEQEGSVPRSEMARLQSLVTLVPGFDESYRRQQDAEEFIRNLTDYLDFTPKDDQLPKFDAHFSDGTQIKDIAETRHFFIPVEKREGDLEFDLQRDIVSTSTLESGITKTCRPNFLPDELFLVIGRFMSQQELREKPAPKLKENEKGKEKIEMETRTRLVKISDEIALNNLKVNLGGSIYRIVGSVIHKGSTISGGHYTATIGDRLHNDSRITEIKSGTYPEKEAYMLRLIKEEE